MNRPEASRRLARLSWKWITPTQQNAALVEESAAAADSLEEQAEMLLQSVSVFRLADKAAPVEAKATQLKSPSMAKPSTSAEDNWTTF
ncbi:Ribose and galactose chemoreceptor protein [Serratia fonticola]|uniref:Ribose and galactose chemoreceptor protein n=1 Tax=Serratia fonticola TaxID=47917 RepID=A0A4U9WGI9_SERFO|nr:Ribose and galactose chemoreceptor protein [Serratia fonticola]